MKNSNKLIWCIIPVLFLSLISSIDAEDDLNYITEQQPNTASAPSPVVKFPSAAATITDDLATTYCVAKSFGADIDSMAAALSWTCGVVDCSLLQPGRSCYDPNSIPAHASYAFNLYYQLNNRMKGTCDFNGTAMVTSTNPSHGACIFKDHEPWFTSSASRLSGILVGVLLVGGILGI
ncbi:hypothetical protein MKX03_008845 [Papaver bracteatum]|nr:hypothetical protein MKX03_008845 [Papaver bracteatum]